MIVGAKKWGASSTAADGSVRRPDRSVIDPATNTVVATIPVGNTPFGIAVSPTGPGAGDVYVTNYSEGTVTVIS